MIGRKAGATLGVVLAAALVAACGKKGPPLPPLVRIPQAPSGFSAQRRAATVDLQFTVPSVNTDGSKPANIDRVEVYALTGGGDVSEQLFLKHGTRVGMVPVKAPVDPNAAAEPDEEEEAPEEPELEGTGLDQGAVGHVEEVLTPAALTPVVLPRDRHTASVDRAGAPLLGPPAAVPSRTYLSVGVNKRGRRGRVSNRVAVPLLPPPAAPPAPSIKYDETTITVAWQPLAGEPQPPTAAGLLPSHTFGPPLPSFAYNVYDVPPGRSEGDAVGTLLTKTPTQTPEYADTRIEWGVERCYAVRTVETVGNLSVESQASPARCEKLVDRFPPAAPKGLTAVASTGSISLIWRPNEEKDLAGYIVLRGVAPAAPTERVTPAPIQDATFKDAVAAGVRYVYAVQAVDKAGNVSEPSAPAEEVAR